MCVSLLLLCSIRLCIFLVNSPLSLLSILTYTAFLDSSAVAELFVDHERQTQVQLLSEWMLLITMNTIDDLRLNSKDMQTDRQTDRTEASDTTSVVESRDKIFAVF